jgi:hypothetical protein
MGGGSKMCSPCYHVICISILRLLGSWVAQWIHGLGYGLDNRQIWARFPTGARISCCPLRPHALRNPATRIRLLPRLSKHGSIPPLLCVFSWHWKLYLWRLSFETWHRVVLYKCTEASGELSGFVFMCSGPGCYVVWTNESCAVSPVIRGSWVWNLLYVTRLAPRIFRSLLDFWKVCVAYSTLKMDVF